MDPGTEKTKGEEAVLHPANQEPEAPEQSVRLSIANPRASVLRAPDALWVSAGLEADDLNALKPASAGSSHMDAVEADLCRQRSDASILRVDCAEGRVRRISAWRGVTSGYDVFYHTGARGIVVSDHFRNILSHLPPVDRQLSPEVACDHFLFRTIPGTNTYCRGVIRLDRGEALCIDPATGTSGTHRFDRVEAAAVPGARDDVLNRLDQALEAVLAPFRDRPRVAALFSGGVDSTLIHSYLGTAVPAIHYELPAYAEDSEADYAEQAARLLGVRLQRYRLESSDFLSLLESSIDATAEPPPHLQFVLLEPLLRLDYDYFVSGERADALFGLGLRAAALAAPLSSALGRHVLGLAEALASSRARRLRRIREAAARLGQSPESLEGFGAQFGVSSERSRIEALFGEGLVRSRLQARIDALHGTFPAVTAKSRFHHHVNLGQMIDYFCDDIMSNTHHLAHALGRSVVSPFSTGRMLDAALSIPPEERYLKGREPKYLLKQLLRRRVPTYPVNQRKGYSQVPLVDLYRDGPLSDVWRRYSVPELVGDAAAAEALLTTPTQMTWDAITLSIWRQRVQNNPDLRMIAGSRAFAWSNA